MTCQIEHSQRAKVFSCREGEESDDDFDQQLRQVNLPLLHPKATVTSEHHPCGAELLEFPFSAKAFYVGESSLSCSCLYTGDIDPLHSKSKPLPDNLREGNILAWKNIFMVEADVAAEICPA